MTLALCPSHYGALAVLGISLEKAGTCMAMMMWLYMENKIDIELFPAWRGCITLLRLCDIASGKSLLPALAALRVV
jgi:hypothetical protein